MGTRDHENMGTDLPVRSAHAGRGFAVMGAPAGSDDDTL